MTLFPRAEYIPDRFTNALRKIKYVGIHGKKQAGKDTFFKAMEKIVAPYKCAKFAYADPLKESMMSMMGGTYENYHGSEAQKQQAMHELWIERYGEMFATYRSGMQFVGTDMFRDKICRLWWVDCNEVKLLNTIQKCDASKLIVVVPDLRFDNEAEHIKTLGGVIVHVVRKDQITEDKHRSESGIDPKYIDMRYVNDSPEAVAKSAAYFIDHFSDYLLPVT